MAIIRMISRDPAEFREFQGRMTTVGKIRLGVYNGRYPEKIDTFRFTSEDGDRVRVIAQAYGGTAEEWQPQGGGPRQWETITALNAVPVLIVNGQDVEPWYEAWGAGRTCLRRCDGITNKIDHTPCLCNGPNRPADPKKLCKPTIRVQVMLAEAPGFGSWMLESHGENACREIAPMAPFIATASIAIPAVLRLRSEARREWNPEKGRFESKSFYVPWFDTPELTLRQIAAGGEELTRAMLAAGGSAIIGGTTRRAIEGAPVAPAPDGPAAPAGLDDRTRTDILTAIEAKTTLAELDALKVKLQERGVDDQRVREAWRSKYDAVEARDRMRVQAETVTADPVDRAEIEAVAEDMAHLRPGAGDDMPRTLPFPSPQEMEAAGSGCCGGYRTPDDMWSPCVPCPVMQAREAGEAAIFDPLPDPLPDSEAAPVEGVVEGAPDPLPQVPDGDYDAAELYVLLMTGASHQAPPLTTAEVGALICRTFDVEHHGNATGMQLARLRAALKAGSVAWRP